jgi:hypothetical protein
VFLTTKGAAWATDKPQDSYTAQYIPAPSNQSAVADVFRGLLLAVAAMQQSSAQAAPLYGGAVHTCFSTVRMELDSIDNVGVL